MSTPDDFVASYIGALLEEPLQPKRAEPSREALAEQVQSLEEEKRRQLQKLLSPELKLTPAAPPPVKPKPVAPAPAKAPVVEAPVAAPVEKPKAKEPSVITPEAERQAAQANPLLAWLDNGRPVWAQEGFDVLLFEVAGLTLAVPLIALGQIYPLSDELTPIFGQAQWMMGLQKSPAGTLRCINTALFVMPERYRPEFIQSARYVISIEGMDWALAVDKVQQPRRLNPDDVTWRSSRSKRPWLAGTVKSAMCALIDIPQMGALLQASDSKRRP